MCILVTGSVYRRDYILLNTNMLGWFLVEMLRTKAVQEWFEICKANFIKSKIFRARG